MSGSFTLNKEVVAFFFTKSENFVEGTKTKCIYSCNSETIGNKKCSSTTNKFKVIVGSGTSNLKSHLAICYDNKYEDIYKNRVREVNGDIRKHVKVDSKTKNIFAWIERVIMDNLPFSFVTKPLTKRNSNLQPISIPTFKKYLDALCYECEGNQKLI